MTAPAIAAMSEQEWQQQFVQLATALGWKHMHVRRSLGKGRRWTTATNVDGWPDLTLWHPKQRRVVFVELKSETGRVTAEQRAVHVSLRTAGADVRVYKPSELAEAHVWLAGPKPRDRGWT